MFIIRTAIFLIHLGILFLLFGTMLNEYIPPQWLGIVNLLSLAFPFLLFLHFVLIFYWLIGFRKRIILFLLSWAFLLAPIQRWVNYSPQKKDETDLKVLSYNTKGVSEEKKEYLNAQNADVLLLQECGWVQKDKMKLKNYPHQAHTEIVSIYSKYPIKRKQKIKLSENGYAIFADIRIKGESIRFINIYLEPFRLDKMMIKPSASAEINELKAKSLLERLIPVFKIHQNQIDEVKSYIENSPYPVILGGDFNAVPNSYEYFQFSNLLNDAFLEIGVGSGTTFHDYSFPIRIDYLFSSSEIIPIKQTTYQDIKLSDHYPISVDFSIK